MSDAPEKDEEMREEAQEPNEEKVAEGGAEADKQGEEVEEDVYEAAEEKDEEDADKAKDEKEEEKKDEEVEPEKPKEPEEPKELEEDAAADSRARLAAGSVKIDGETTLNVMSSCQGKILMTLSEGGFQHLVGCSRSATGVKAGRYMFEVKIVESRTPSTSGGKYEPMPRHLLRLGFSTSASPLFLSLKDEGSEGSIFFDSEGDFVHEKTREKCGRKFQTSQVLAVLLNLDPESPNASTISLFADGQRVCQPKKLPESLQGQTLYPTVNYKSMTLNVNFGPEPLTPLEFKCRMVQDAAKADTQEAKAAAKGAREVIFPVGLPDQGTFAWLDGFLKENPKYTELSDRAILAMAEQSNIYRMKGYAWKNSNDRPGWEFGLREMDDGSIKALIDTVAPMLNRSYVKMEVKGNLTASERKESLAHFDGPDFKKIAVVVMGEPPKDFKAKVQADLLEQKRGLAEAEARAEFDRSKRDKPAKKEKKEKPKKDAGEGEEEDKEMEVEEAADEEVEVAEESLEEVVAKARAAVELTDAEKAQSFAKPGSASGDIVDKELSASFSSFTIPTKEEGFDEVRYVWQKQAACDVYLKEWILSQKLTQRVEDLQPGAWFKEQYDEWGNVLDAWRRKQSDWENNRRRPERRNGDSDKSKKEEAKKEEEKKEEKKDEDADEAEKEEKPMEVDGEEKKEETEEKAEVEEKKEEKVEEPKEIHAEDLDVWTVEDINDVGNGEPLFANFRFEDWTMLGLRYDLHLLVHSFKKDMDDPERSSFAENHLSFYHNKYFRKECNPKWYGCSSSTTLLEMIKDTLELNAKNTTLEPMLSEDSPLDNFVRITEDERRERQRKIDAGDENAALNIQRPAGRGNERDAKGRGGKGGYNDRGSANGGKGDYNNRGSYNDRGSGGHNDRGRDDRGGYSSSRVPLAAPGYSRGAPAAPARGAPAAPASRYADSRGGGYSARDGGRDAGRYGSSAPAPAARTSSGYGSGYGAPAPAYGRPADAYGAQKRSYPPQSSSSMPPSKTSRSDAYRGAPPAREPPRGSYSGQGGRR